MLSGDICAKSRTCGTFEGCRSCELFWPTLPYLPKQASWSDRWRLFSWLDSIVIVPCEVRSKWSFSLESRRSSVVWGSWEARLPWSLWPFQVSLIDVIFYSQYLLHWLVIMPSHCQKLWPPWCSRRRIFQSYQSYIQILLCFSTNSLLWASLMRVLFASSFLSLFVPVMYFSCVRVGCFPLRSLEDLSLEQWL